jgi:hypothetical protein
MGKHDSAPTVGWVVSSHVTKWLSLAFVILILFLSIAGWTIYYTVNRDCENYYQRDSQVGSFWFTVRIGSTKDGCPDPYRIFR